MCSDITTHLSSYLSGLLFCQFAIQDRLLYCLHELTHHAFLFSLCNIMLCSTMCILSVCLSLLFYATFLYCCLLQCSFISGSALIPSGWRKMAGRQTKHVALPSIYSSPTLPIHTTQDRTGRRKGGWRLFGGGMYDTGRKKKVQAAINLRHCLPHHPHPLHSLP